MRKGAATQHPASLFMQSASVLQCFVAAPVGSLFVWIDGCSFQYFVRTFRLTNLPAVASPKPCVYDKASNAPSSLEYVCEGPLLSRVS